MSAPTRTPLNWRLFLILWLGGSVATLPLIPVTVVLGQAGLATPAVSWQSATMAVLLTAMVIFSAAVYVGLRAGQRMGLGAPLIEAWLAGKPAGDTATRLAKAAGAGGLLGLAGVVVAVTVAGDVASSAAPAEDVVPLWVAAAQALGAGIGEELLFRLGLMSLFALLAWRLLPAGEAGEHRPSNLGMAVALVLAAVVFTAVHGSPGGAAETTALLVAQPMQFMRLAGGVLFGWLFWKQGLESAMAAHFAYNVVLFYGLVAAV